LCAAFPSFPPLAPNVHFSPHHLLLTCMEYFRFLSMPTLTISSHLVTTIRALQGNSQLSSNALVSDSLSTHVKGHLGPYSLLIVNGPYICVVTSKKPTLIRVKCEYPSKTPTIYTCKAAKNVKRCIHKMHATTILTLAVCAPVRIRMHRNSINY
jgi:hypothetical protein